MAKEDGPPPRSWAELIHYAMKETPLGIVVFILTGLIGIFVMMAFPWIIMGSMKMAMEFIKDPQAIFSTTRDCLDLKEVGGRVYKIDQCKKTIEPFTPDRRD